MSGPVDNREALVIYGEALIDAFPDQEQIGGAPFNVARISALFGRDPLLITRLGQDPRAGLIMADMQRFGMDLTGVQIDPGHPTGLVQVDMQGNSHRFLLLPDQAYDYIEAQPAAQAMAHYQTRHPGPGVLYYGTLIRRAQKSGATLTELLQHSRAIKFLDLNLRDDPHQTATLNHSLHAADILKVNHDELNVLADRFMPEYHPLNFDLTQDQRVRRLFDAIGQLIDLFTLQAVIVTLGANGYVYLNHSGQQINGFSDQPDCIQVVDTVGCGDAFSALFITGLLNQWPVYLTLRRAHQFAGATCTIQGAVSADLQFYKPWQQQWQSSLPSSEG